jgi:hypothetical protein
MTDNEAEPEKLPTATRLVGIDRGRTWTFNKYHPFGIGERIPVDPPGTIAVVKSSRHVETEGGELLLECVVVLERPEQPS